MRSGTASDALRYRKRDGEGRDSVKALTLTQPWATLVAIGAKRIETRSWSTSYRGPLAIHAAKGFPGWAKEFGKSTECYEALRKYSTADDERRFLSGGLAYPLGVVLATCRIAACVKTEKLLSERPYAPDMTEQEKSFGDYSEGRWGWMLADVKRLPEPIPAKGALGLWEWEAPNIRR